MSLNGSNNAPGQPRLHSTRSFPRMDDGSDVSPLARVRAKTVQSMAVPEPVDADALPIPLIDDDAEQDVGPDLFEKSSSFDSGTADDGQQGEEASVLSRDVEDDPEELPIELISLTDRFVNSLTAKVHASPPSIEQISNLFQGFYERAESHIATHISALASRIHRDPSPYLPDQRSRAGTQTKANKDANTTPSRQMLTASEVTERRAARKLLAHKQVALEEAVERRACESIYDKIWRHKSTLDEARDEQLRSKTAALLLVGINLKDLGIDIDIAAVDEVKQKETDECLAVARDFLARMNDEKYPLGKLRHLASAHKAIVDALTKLLPSSSSADEILPTLIYSLVTCPPEGINVISNLFFIQRFRSSSKVDGETAYCLTNLEAAICFLENVDLSELRADDMQDGQTKSLSDVSKPLDPKTASKETTTITVTQVASPEFSKPGGTETAAETLPRSQLSTSSQRRLNSLFQPPSKVLGAANDAVRNTADQSIKNIGATLDSSFNFLFGRLKELQSSEIPGSDGRSSVVPKTLADARRLITSPASDQENQTPKGPAPPQLRRISSKAEDTFLGLVGGQRTQRDRSADSTRTQGSRKSSTMPLPTKDEPSSNPSSQASPTGAPIAQTPLDSVRNFGNTLNPLNHIPGMIRSFGRATPDLPGGGSAASSPSERAKPPPTPREVSSSLPSPPHKPDPPIQRFIQTQDANDLTIRDVAVLLEDYKRLAAVLQEQSAGPGSK